jgi:hypothetical protein
MPGILDRLKAALADRYADDREAVLAERRRSVSPQT